MLLNCGARGNSWESLGLQGDPPSPSKGSQSWLFIGRTDAETETPTLWPPDAKSWLIWKDPDAGKDWRQEEKGMTEDEMVGWHHWLKGHEFEKTPGVGDGQGCLACRSSCGCKESDTTKWLNWSELIYIYIYISIKIICILCLLLLLSHFSRVWLCVTPYTAAHQAPPSLEFSRQEHWSGLPFPSPMHESEKSK